MFQPVPDDSTISGLSIEDEILTKMVASARAGDRSAFEFLYRRYNWPIWNFLMRLVCNREIAEDLHQETFIRAWLKLPEIDAKRDLRFGSWLYRLTSHIAIDYLRRANKFDFLSLPEDESDECSVVANLSVKGPEEAFFERNSLEQALMQVWPRFRICLLMQDQWGFSQREIAEILGISVGCVGAYICRGREQFRQAYRYSNEERRKPMKHETKG